MENKEPNKGLLVGAIVCFFFGLWIVSVALFIMYFKQPNGLQGSSIAGTTNSNKLSSDKIPSKCPSCGANLDKSSSKCPYCGTKFM